MKLLGWQLNFCSRYKLEADSNLSYLGQYHLDTISLAKMDANLVQFAGPQG